MPTSSTPRRHTPSDRSTPSESPAPEGSPGTPAPEGSEEAAEVTGGPNTGTVTIPADAFAALQKQLADLQERQDRAEKDKEDAVRAASPESHFEDIEPEDQSEPEPTFIVHRHTYTEGGVQKTTDYRMKTEDYGRILAERGW